MPSRGSSAGRAGSGRSCPRISLSAHDTGTEGVATVLDDAVQFADQRFGLFVSYFEVHTLNIGALTSGY